MSSIQYQLNKRYRFEIQRKVREYYTATKHIRDQRIKLRNVFLPKIVMKDGVCEWIYPNEFLNLDAKFESLQNLIWDTIFGKDNIANKPLQMTTKAMPF